MATVLQRFVVTSVKYLPGTSYKAPTVTVTHFLRRKTVFYSEWKQHVNSAF